MVKCPVCGQTILSPGFLFGTVIKQRCYQCKCGSRVYVAEETPKQLKEIIKKK